VLSRKYAHLLQARPSSAKENQFIGESPPLQPLCLAKRTPASGKVKPDSIRLEVGRVEKQKVARPSAFLMENAQQEEPPGRIESIYDKVVRHLNQFNGKSAAEPAPRRFATEGG
jgi:hypothetical protein